MLGKKKLTKMMDIKTHECIMKHLHVLENTTSKKEQAKELEELRAFLAKIFTYSDLVEFHDDHIVEIAETVAGLYPERENIGDYAYHIQKYLAKQISKYEQRCAKYKQTLSRKAKGDDGEYMDLKYRTWTYTDGYYCQRANMYRLLQSTLNELSVYFDKEVR